MDIEITKKREDKCPYCKKKLNEIDSQSMVNQILHLQMCPKRPITVDKPINYKQTKLTNYFQKK